MAYNNAHGIQTVSESTYDAMVEATPTCIDKISKCNDKGGFSCSLAYTYCNTKLTTPYYQTGLNPYDIRKECGDNPLCYDFSNVRAPSSRRAKRAQKKEAVARRAPPQPGDPGGRVRMVLSRGRFGGLPPTDRDSARLCRL
jgi:hypothetical protein